MKESCSIWNANECACILYPLEGLAKGINVFWSKNENNTKYIWIKFVSKGYSFNGNSTYSIYKKLIILQISYNKSTIAKLYIIIDVPNLANVKVPLTTGFQWRCYDFGINNFFYLNHVAKPIL